MKKITIILAFALITGFISCKDDDAQAPDYSFKVSSLILENAQQKDDVVYYGTTDSTAVKIQFTQPVDRNSAANRIELLPSDDVGNPILVDISFEDGDKIVCLKPINKLQWYAQYKLVVWDKLYSANGLEINTGRNYTIITSIDSTDCFPRISDEDLLTKVQKQTFNYFWSGAHPSSGMARERDNSGNTVTTGGTGFGIMAMISAVNRGFITRQEALTRVQKIVSFLKTCDRYHGAFSHWINGSTGKTIPFSDADDGADIVETSFLIQGLLTARNYFNQGGAEETLRNDISKIWEAVEWSWFAKDGGDILYWNWSPTKAWAINLPVQGWNEALITYVLAASSPTHPISKTVYDTGWAKNGDMLNGNSYYGIVLPAGEAYGGPLFFSHYSFLGLCPIGLSDRYIADYFEQNKNHSLINNQYCINNPKSYIGYSADCWGLSASDNEKGYSAHSPTNDLGTITPTAAIGSMPYIPNESMKALRFFYYKLGNKMWGNYGFYDAFSLSARWFDNQWLAIDQGPIVVMIENYRSNLLWHWFMQDTDVQKGLTSLGFQYKVPEIK